MSSPRLQAFTRDTRTTMLHKRSIRSSRTALMIVLNDGWR